MEQAMREQINFFTTEDTKCLMKSNKCLVIKLKQTQWFNSPYACLRHTSKLHHQASFWN